MLDIKRQIGRAIEKSIRFIPKLYAPPYGYRYTINHDLEKHPAAALYGTWSVAFLNNLLLGDKWTDREEKDFILSVLISHRLKNGIFYPAALDKISHPKSKEYTYLHCYNYSVGAALEIDPDFDFQSSYMDKFLEKDFLDRWLNQRSLLRPWEESNNIVNVASYLALCNDHGQSAGKERLYQMLEWHHKVQNPLTGGFEIFKPSRKNILQSMAGAVHNFHIHDYLGEPLKYERIIAGNVLPFLFSGPLTACLSIDFVELLCRTIGFVDTPLNYEQALLYHLKSLLGYQNLDGGWFENESPKKPTSANGMVETNASSNSYATWFRMCSIGMIDLTLLDGDPDKWHFRKSLGMGYLGSRWNKIKRDSLKIDRMCVLKYKINDSPHYIKSRIIELASKLV